jgi:hypothetical protein
MVELTTKQELADLLNQGIRPGLKVRFQNVRLDIHVREFGKFNRRREIKREGNFSLVRERDGTYSVVEETSNFHLSLPSDEILHHSELPEMSTYIPLLVRDYEGEEGVGLFVDIYYTEDTKVLC